MILSRALRSDAAALARVMYRAIHLGATLYNKAERRAWQPRPMSAEAFQRIIAEQEVWVARGVKGPVGFVSLRRDGYVDLVFLMPHMHGRGLFRRLMDLLDKGEVRPRTVHASLHAEPAFLRLGFKVQHREVVARNGQRMRRAFMVRGRTAVYGGAT